MPKNIKSVLSWSVSKEMLPTYFRATQNEATSYIVARTIYLQDATKY